MNGVPLAPNRISTHPSNRWRRGWEETERVGLAGLAASLGGGVLQARPDCPWLRQAAHGGLGPPYCGVTAGELRAERTLGRF